MTYLTYAALPVTPDPRAVQERFASVEYMDEILAKSNAESRRQSLAALLLLAETLKLAGIDAKSLVICRDELGRPTVAGCSELDFSLSHTKKAAACAVMVEKAARVGADLEEEQPRERARAIAKRFFTDGEKEIVSIKGAEGFAEVWTKKEALYKYLKHPSNDPLDLDITARENEKFDTFDTQYGKISLCRSKKTADEPKIAKIILKS